MNSFFLIDKPLHWSSFDVIRVLKKKMNIKKVGHTGTLDPLATGGLLIATGGYTKLIPYLEKSAKEYEFVIMLDGTTESFDLGEEVAYISEEKQEYFRNHINKQHIQNLIHNKFTGKITQIPPKYSAVKINGRRAYELARKGEEVEVKSREVEIFDIKIQDFEYPKLSVKATVSAGTYIRSIGADLGMFLGTGGYISYLRRTRLGDLDMTMACDIQRVSMGDQLLIQQVLDEKKFFPSDHNMLEALNVGKQFKMNAGNVKMSGEYLYVLGGNNEVSHVVLYDGIFLIPKRQI